MLKLIIFLIGIVVGIVITMAFAVIAWDMEKERRQHDRELSDWPPKGDEYR